MDREKFIIDLKEYGIKNSIPNISIVNANFIRDIIKIQKTKKMLEIGTANGFSSINFGIELEKQNGKIISIDFSPNSIEEAKNNIKKVKLEKYIKLVLGNAIEEIPKFKNDYFDLIFIDGMKKRTKDFLELSMPKLKNNGIIIIDDIIKFKEKMYGLWDYLKSNNIRYNIIPIDLEDGILMIIKD